MAAKKHKPDSAKTPPAASIRVLVVDNDRSHAQAMAETLERVGYDCDVAMSGPEGASGRLVSA